MKGMDISKMGRPKLHTFDVELAVARFFHPRQNLIVPNVSWGLGFRYELDLLIVSHQSRHCTEVEIKVSAGDIKADLKKDPNAHNSPRIRRFFYAVPWYLQNCEHLPINAGLISVDEELRCKIMRPPKINRLAKPLSDADYLKLLELGCMRIWTLKDAIQGRLWEIHYLKERLYDGLHCTD